MGTATTHDRLLKVLRDPYTGPLVAEYFMTDEDGTPWFTGAWFERLGGGGDSPETRDVVTAADLTAVGTLAVAAEG